MSGGRPDTVEQGDSYDFSYELENGASAYEGHQLTVRQYPGETPAIDRPVTPWDDDVIYNRLTPAETAALDVGLWYLTIASTTTGAVQVVTHSRRLQVTPTWA